MGLLVKRGHSSAYVPLYQVGLSRTVIVVGLGNVGTEYEGTRHNVGFACLDAFAAANEFPAWVAKKSLKCELTSQNHAETRVILVKPTTFMNLSGEAVQAVQQFYKVGPESTVIVHDELDIPFGQIRIRQGGGSAGNNGLKSIIQHGGENALRIRIGIHNDHADKQDGADFVLSKFNAHEQGKLKDLKREVSSMLSEYIYGGDLMADTRSFLA
jgi:PTH1 family peptidyl-tRNA hydrolase